MSHDFAFWEGDEPLENEEEGEIYLSLIETGASEKIGPSDKIEAMASELDSLWPAPAVGETVDYVRLYGETRWSHDEDGLQSVIPTLPPISLSNSGRNRARHGIVF